MKTFGFIQQTNIIDQLHDAGIYLFIHFKSIYGYVMMWKIKYHALTTERIRRQESWRNVMYIVMFCPLKPGFIWFKLGLTHWAGQNQFNPGKMPTLICNYGIRNLFVPKTIRSLEHSFPWWNFRSQDYLFPGTFVPWTVRFMELSFPGTFVPGTLDLSCRGLFVHLSAEQYLVWNSITNRSVVLWQWQCTAAIHKQSGTRERFFEW